MTDDLEPEEWQSLYGRMVIVGMEILDREDTGEVVTTISSEYELVIRTKTQSLCYSTHGDTRMPSPPPHRPGAECLYYGNHDA